MIQLATQFSDFSIEGVDFCILAVEVRFQLICPQLSVICHLLPLVDQLADIIQEGGVFLSRSVTNVTNPPLLMSSVRMVIMIVVQSIHVG